MALPKVETATLKARWRTIASWVAIVVGVALLTGGWFGVSAQTEVAKQLPYLISGGLGGIAAIGAGVALQVAEDLRTDRSRLGRLEAELLEVRDLLRTIADGRATNGKKRAS
jgi:hypothetical protein